MIDITSLFKAFIKTVRTRNKALGLNNKPEDPINAFSHDHPKIFPKFQTRAKEIVPNVAKLKGV
jgi:syntaxin 18